MKLFFSAVFSVATSSAATSSSTTSSVVASAAAITAPIGPTTTLTPSATPGSTSSHFFMLVEVLGAEVVGEVDSLTVEQLDLLWLCITNAAAPVATVGSLAVSFIGLESEERVGIDVGTGGVARMRNVQMGLQLVLSLKRDIALLAAGVVGADEVRARKVDL